MARLIQCVPNFSEGRREEVVRRIVTAIDSASGAQVVDWSMDADHNRCVVTFIGSPEEVRQSVLNGAKTAVELINLNLHQGGHPRIGAVDVIPIIPLENVTMEEAVVLSKEIGADIADSLNLPVYFYEESACSPERRNLADVRRGGYESFRQGELIGTRKPDIGPSKVHPTAGAVAIGARGPLIAYNVNLNTNNIAVARAIAAKIRALRECGSGMMGVKAIGIRLESRGIVQVSTNITRPNETGLYEVYSFIEREAKDMGVEVLESELIGALREEALVDVACKALKFANLNQQRVLDYWMRSRG